MVPCVVNSRSPSPQLRQSLAIPALNSNYSCSPHPSHMLQRERAEILSFSPPSTFNFRPSASPLAFLLCHLDQQSLHRAPFVFNNIHVAPLATPLFSHSCKMMGGVPPSSTFHLQTSSIQAISIASAFPFGLVGFLGYFSRDQKESWSRWKL